MAIDSPVYLTMSENLLQHHVFSMSSSEPFPPDVFRTPGYPFFLALIQGLGMHSFYWTVFWQELIYLACIALFFVQGRPLFGEKIVRIGVIFLLLEPGGLSYPKQLLSETLFLPFVFCSLLAMGAYMHKARWQPLILSACAAGLGAWVRPAIIYLPLVMTVCVLVFTYKEKRVWLQQGVFLLVFMVMISPWLLRNYNQFGQVIISGQTSNMLAGYHVPITWESAKNEPFEEGFAEVKRLVDQAVEQKSKKLGRPLNQVERYQLQQKFALNELLKYPADYALEWLFGILKTMNGGNATEVYRTLNLRVDRLHYFAIQETNFVKKVGIFLLHQDFLFVLMVFLRVLIGIFALLGVVPIYKSKNAFLWLMLLTNFYFICLPGPMGYARFRFPVEVFWFIQAFYGLTFFTEWLQKRKPATELVQEAVEN